MKTLWYRGLGPILMALYLILVLVRPSQAYAFLLGLAVILAARAWEVWGAVLSSLAAGGLLTFGLYRLDEQALLHNPAVIGGYLWAVVATLMTALFVGSLTRQTRRLDRVNADLRQAQQRLTALHRIALSHSSTLDVPKLLDLILEQLGQLWGFDYGAILLWDEESKALAVSATRGYAGEPDLRVPRDQGITGACFALAQPICVGDVTQDPRYVPGLPDARSELAVPLIWEGKALGVLNVESLAENAYSDADVSLLTTMAEQAAASIGIARLHQETRNLAITDAHTGLFNYRHFQEQVAAKVRDAQLTGTQCSLIMIDLDHFKRCNDTYGHPTGDEVLKQAAKLLRESTREGDMVFRYGGEEFAVLLPGAPAEAASRVAERIRTRVEGHTFLTRSGHPLEFSLSVSQGVANYPQDAISAVDLLVVADKALYTAKGQGRNQVVCALTLKAEAI